MSALPGSLARIGQLYPSGGLCDDEVQNMAPPGLLVHTTRLAFRRASLEDDRRLADDLERHAELLAHAEVDLIAFNCTAASMVIGPNAINRRIEAATGIASVTTIEAVMDALTAAGLRRLLLMTPYATAVVEEEAHFLDAAGHEVVHACGPVCTTPVEQGKLSPQIWLDLAREHTNRDFDGVLLSCAGVRVSPIIEDLERIFQRPVVTSNQALLWKILIALGLKERPRGAGRLLAGEFDT